jgi:ribonuclease HI
MKHSNKKQRQLAAEYLARQRKNGNSMEGNIIGYFDGACEPKNPGGNMGVGSCIRVAGKELFSNSKFVKAHYCNSNNVAEYMAFESILDFIITEKWRDRSITIYGDSKLVIEQQFGSWRIKDGFYVDYARRCKQKVIMLKDYGIKITGIWIHREQNKYADELSKAELINNNVQFQIQPLSLDSSK